MNDYQLTCCGHTVSSSSTGDKLTGMLCKKCHRYVVAYRIGSDLWEGWVKDQARRADGGKRRKHSGRHRA